jgi:hypothetical protein
MKNKGLIIALVLGLVVVIAVFFPGGGDTEKVIQAYIKRDSALRVARNAREQYNRLRYDSARLYRSLDMATQIVNEQQQRLTQLEAREKSYKILLHKRVEVYTPSQLDSVWCELFPRPDTAVYRGGPAAGVGEN